MEEYSLNSKFDMEKHKEKFVNYLEVLIKEDGEIVYAVPSHQEKAIELVMEKYQWTRDDVIKYTPKEYFFDWLEWLLSECGAISVWDDFYIGEPNKNQKNKLKMLKLNGIYKGSLNKKFEAGVDW